MSVSTEITKTKLSCCSKEPTTISGFCKTNALYCWTVNQNTIEFFKEENINGCIQFDDEITACCGFRSKLALKFVVATGDKLWLCHSSNGTKSKFIKTPNSITHIFIIENKDNYEERIQNMATPIIVAFIDGTSFICDIELEQPDFIELNTKPFGPITSLEILDDIGCVTFAYDTGRYEFWSLITLIDNPLFVNKQEIDEKTIFEVTGFSTVLDPELDIGYIWVCSEAKTSSASLLEYKCEVKTSVDGLVTHYLNISDVVYRHYFEGSKIVSTKSIKEYGNNSKPTKCYFITETHKKHQKKYNLELFDLGTRKKFEQSFFSYSLNDISASDTISSIYLDKRSVNDCLSTLIPLENQNISTKLGIPTLNFNISLLIGKVIYTVSFSSPAQMMVENLLYDRSDVLDGNLFETYLNYQNVGFLQPSMSIKDEKSIFTALLDLLLEMGFFSIITDFLNKKHDEDVNGIPKSYSSSIQLIYDWLLSKLNELHSKTKEEVVKLTNPIVDKYFQKMEVISKFRILSRNYSFLNVITQPLYNRVEDNYKQIVKSTKSIIIMQIEFLELIEFLVENALLPLGECHEYFNELESVWNSFTEKNELILIEYFLPKGVKMTFPPKSAVDLLNLFSYGKNDHGHSNQKNLVIYFILKFLFHATTLSTLEVPNSGKILDTFCSRFEITNSWRNYIDAIFKLDFCEIVDKELLITELTSLPNPPLKDLIMEKLFILEDSVALSKLFSFWGATDPNFQIVILLHHGMVKDAFAFQRNYQGDERDDLFRRLISALTSKQMLDFISLPFDEIEEKILIEHQTSHPDLLFSYFITRSRFIDAFKMDKISKANEIIRNTLKEKIIPNVQKEISMGDIKNLKLSKIVRESLNEETFVSFPKVKIEKNEKQEQNSVALPSTPFKTKKPQPNFVYRKKLNTLKIDEMIEEEEEEEENEEGLEESSYDSFEEDDYDLPPKVSLSHKQQNEFNFDEDSDGF